MRFAVALFSLLGLVLAGCQTASHKLPLEQIADLRVAEVVVSVPDGAQIPEDLRNVIAPKVKAAFERQLTQRFKGSNPVRVEVTVRRVIATPTVERVVFGGGSSMTAA